MLMDFIVIPEGLNHRIINAKKLKRLVISFSYSVRAENPTFLVVSSTSKKKGVREKKAPHQKSAAYVLYQIYNFTSSLTVAF